MLKLEQAVLVEGKYDAARLTNLVDATILTTDGSRVFRDKELQNMLKRIAAAQGLIILTDSDDAGFRIRHFVTGVSAGIVDEQALLDLQYSEDSRAQVDLNCVMNELGEIIELQGTGEGRAFTLAEQKELVRLCAKGNRELLKSQKEALGGAL